MKAFAVTVALAGLASAAPSVAASASCRCLPGDACWPSESAWSQLNQTVGGRLIATVPIGNPCHDPNYDAVACAALQATWTSPETHLDSTSSPMEPFFANRTCDPFTDQTSACTLGNLVSYAVNVTGVEDVQAALAFAKSNNIRVLVRNTGHDFLGRSTGAGALAIWTHNLQSLDFIDWADQDGYSGKAVKIAAGAMGYQIVEAAQEQDLLVVGGECPTVGLAGGYIQGGGHSALSTNYGLAADNALEFEVVLANGYAVVANRTSNPDLFWALRGGGGGTFGVVMSVTVAAHPAKQVAGALLQTASSYTTPDKWNQMLSRFHALLPAMTDAGASVVYIASKDVFQIKPITVLDSNQTYVKDVVLAPFLAVLAELAIPAAVSYTELSYRDHYDKYMGPLPTGWITIASWTFGGRLIPRAVLEDSAAHATFSTALANITGDGLYAIGTAAKYDSQTEDIGATPVWRTSTVQMQLLAPWNNSAAAWDTNVELQRRMTANWMPTIEAATPGGGSYLNEADFNQPNWQDAFFGSNYPRLLELKKKFDPQNLFYILKGVGSEAWNVGADGRMCRA